jgi:hypothetical protein
MRSVGPFATARSIHPLAILRVFKLCERNLNVDRRNATRGRLHHVEELREILFTHGLSASGSHSSHPANVAGMWLERVNDSFRPNRGHSA